MVITEFDEAGFTDINSQLGKLVPSGSITIPPDITLDESAEEIVWKWGFRQPSKHVTPTPEMLNDFVHLCESTPLQIWEYAKAWGVLELDKSGRPCIGSGDVNRREPIALWRYFSRRARAVLNIAARLKRGKPGLLKDWLALHGTGAHTGDFVQDLHRFGPAPLWIWEQGEYPIKARGFGKPGYKSSVVAERMFLSLEVVLWLRLGRVGFVIAPEGSRWELEIDYGGCLLSAISLQLALTLAGVGALFVCSACGRPYAREKKRPKAGQGNYCPKCGHTEAVKRADLKRRVRKSFSAGESPSAISRKMNLDPKTVKGWLKKKES